MRKSGFGWLVSSSRRIRRTRSQASRSRNEMKRASSYSNSTSVAVWTELSNGPPSGKQPPGGAAEPDEAGHEPLRVLDAALLAAEARGCSHLLDDVDAVVV